jgi:hypothetical protein
MLFKNTSEPRAPPWKFLLGCFAVLIMLHFILVGLEPTNGSSIGGEALSPAIVDTNATTHGIAGTFEDFKALVGLGKGPKGSKASALDHQPSTPNGKKRPPPPSAKDTEGEEYMAICMAVKNQSLDLPEWFVHHYHHLGIRRFYIMDDGSEPPLSEVTEYGIPREHITFQYFDQTQHVGVMQDHVYNICANEYRDKHTWMGFFDADEYLEMTGGETLNDFLRTYEVNEGVGAIAVSWQTHTSNGLLTRPQSCRQGFTDCIWDGQGHNGMFKSIVRLANHNGHNHVHQAHLNQGTVQVDEHGQHTPNAARWPATKDRIALHHYAIKSRQEYQEKVDRGNAMDQPKDWMFWDSVEGMGGVECLSMADYRP